MDSIKYFVWIFFVLKHCESAKILGIFHMPGRSHYQAGNGMMKILAEHGHEVTLVSPFEEKNPPKNYRDVVMTGVLKRKKERNFFDLTPNPLFAPFVFTPIAESMMENLFNNTNFQKLMNSGETFDLVIMEHFSSDAMKYVAHHFKAPLIVFSSLETNDWTNPYQGNPDNPSYFPVKDLHYTGHMTFCQRLKNAVTYTLNQMFRVFIYIPRQNHLLHKYFPDAPDLNNFINNVALVFTNTEPSIHESFPRVPSIISVGGFHIKKPKALPKDLQDILDNAENGVVYFSLGSNVKSTSLPVSKREIIMKAFSKLKQIVIWKFEDETLPGKPDNVIIKKWLPQNDIFAHKNVKLFISHGGIFSTMEAIYHGLPILAIPIFGDQIVTAKRAAEDGYARWLDFKKLNERDLDSSIEDFLSNPKYIQNAKLRSSIMRDKLVSPQDTIKFWVDYVIRHKGADHLRVASLKLTWYQYLLLDVVAFIAAVTIAAFVTSKFIVKLMTRLMKRKRELKLKKN